MSTEKKWQLPTGIVSVSDISRLQRELQQLDTFLRQNEIIRQAGAPTQLPKSSQLFLEIVTNNKLNMLKEADRQDLANFLEALRESAPILHISFNADPPPLFLQRLISWLRQHVHHYVILQIGLQPTIGAGCIVRTENRYFDFSLRQRFANQRSLLMQALAIESVLNAAVKKDDKQ